MRSLTRSDSMDNVPLGRTAPKLAQKSLRILLGVTAVIFLFCLYTWGISQNPRGFYLDESATAYNAYLVSRTGAGEFGPRFPLLFQEYAVSNATYINPLTIYLMAIVFRFVPPSIAVAREFAAFWMFAASLLTRRVGKTHFWPAYDRRSRCRKRASDALVLRNRPIGLGCAFLRFHSCPVPACRLRHSIQRNVELARHYDGRRKPGRGDVWLF